MLENVAFQYVSQSEETLRLIGYGLIIFGAVIAGLTSRSTMVILRAPYFAYSGILMLVAAAIQFIWLGYLPAIAGGYLWVFFSVDVITSIVIGYFYGVIAMARSRDAYGHARSAVLAFIPVANLVLLFTSSKNEMSATPTIPLLSGGVGVLTGFIALVASFSLSGYLAVEMQRIVDDVENNPAAQLMSIEYMLRAQGLEETLKQMAAEVPAQQIDEATTLRRVEAYGVTLHYIYDVSVDAEALPVSMRTGLVQQNCTFELMRRVIEAGATIEHVYFRRDGSEIGTVLVMREICGF